MCSIQHQCTTDRAERETLRQAQSHLLQLTRDGQYELGICWITVSKLSLQDSRELATLAAESVRGLDCVRQLEFCSFVMIGPWTRS